MRFSARIFAIAAGILLLSSLLVPFSFAFAQTPLLVSPTPQTTDAGKTNSPLPPIPIFAQEALWGMISFTSCVISGKDVTSTSQQCFGYNSQTGQATQLSSNGGLIGLSTSAIAILYNPPQIHVDSYLSYLQNNFGITKRALAASGPTGSSGLAQLAPILNLWVAFRNITYVFFVLVFVVVGFAIMLRAKIDPRTVMTIENQIPKIIIALLLVSFSYAIAGFVIDLMWLLTYLTINLFSGLDSGGLQAGAMTQKIMENPFFFLNDAVRGGILGMAAVGGQSVYTIMIPMVKQLLDVPLLGGLFEIIPGIQCIVNTFMGLAIGAVTNPVKTVINTGLSFLGAGMNPWNGLAACTREGAIQLSSDLAGITAFMIFGFAILFALFRVWFALLKSYALFIIYAILGPFFIMLGILPETKINFDNWLRHLLAYSLVFPYAIGIILLGRLISDAYITSSTKVSYVPPLIGVPANTVSPLGTLLGFAVLMLLPQALTMLQDALKAPDMKYLPGIGQMVGQGMKATSTTTNKIYDRFMRKENIMEGKSEGGVRRFLLGAKGSKRRQFIGDLGPSK